MGKNPSVREHILGIVDPPNSGINQLYNAVIVAGFNFFGTLAGLGATGLLSDPSTGLVAAAISAGVSFFGSLVAQRGLRHTSEPE